MSILNKKVLDYASAQVGRRVFANSKAHGECWDLAFLALKESGAKTPHDFGNLYQWSGKKVELNQAKAGDIIQFRRFVIVLEQKTTITKKDGSWRTNTQTKTQHIGAPHHTAIIKSIGANGQVQVLEQNVNNRKTTHHGEYYLKANQFTKGDTETSITIKGQFIIYRPQAKRS